MQGHDLGNQDVHIPTRTESSHSLSSQVSLFPTSVDSCPRYAAAYPSAVIPVLAFDPMMSFAFAAARVYYVQSMETLVSSPAAIGRSLRYQTGQPYNVW